MTFNEHHISLLSKGLKFCPSQDRVDMAKPRSDLDKFHHKLRFRAIFHKDDKSKLPPKPVGTPTKLARDRAVNDTQGNPLSQFLSHPITNSSRAS